MTPKGKVKELINKYVYLFGYSHGEYLEIYEAKQCVLFEVDEIILALTFNELQNKSMIEYWNKAKKEIERLICQI